MREALATSRQTEYFTEQGLRTQRTNKKKHNNSEMNSGS